MRESRMGKCLKYPWDRLARCFMTILRAIIINWDATLLNGLRLWMGESEILLLGAGQKINAENNSVFDLNLLQFCNVENAVVNWSSETQNFKSFENFRVWRILILLKLIERKNYSLQFYVFSKCILIINKYSCKWCFWNHDLLHAKNVLCRVMK